MVKLDIRLHRRDVHHVRMSPIVAYVPVAVQNVAKYRTRTFDGKASSKLQFMGRVFCAGRLV